MTGGQFGEVDLDLLADYVGGALDGTPEAAELERLIDQDPAWADAYLALTTGIDAVRLDLAALVSEPTPMPAEVTDRLTVAITRASRPGATRPTATGAPVGVPVAAAATQDAADPIDDPANDTPVDANDQAAAKPVAPATEPDDADAERGDIDTGTGRGNPDSGRIRPVRRPRRSGVPAQPGTASMPAARGPGRRRQWARRMAGPVLIATVVAGFAGFTLSRLGVVGNTPDEASTALNSAGDAAERTGALGSGPSRAVVEPSAERMLATGTDYTPTSLPGAVSGLAKLTTPSARAAGPDSAAPDTLASSPSTATESPATGGTPRIGGAPTTVFGLERLADRSVLADCLDAVAMAHAQGPIAVDLVDYASFQGRAALVVVFTDRAGSRWAWVTGPGCGTPPSDPDVTYQTRVG